MMSTETTPRIYVACLSSYNAGILHGRWIDANQDSEVIREEIADMLAESPSADAEEYAIHDHEGFGGIAIGEHDDIDKIAELAEQLTEHGEAYAAFCNLVGLDYATPEGFEDEYSGHYDSETAYAEDYIDSCYDLERMMGNLAYYFDYERFAHDLFISDLASVDSSEGGVYVFQR
jgi:antirestriction protein